MTGKCYLAFGDILNESPSEWSKKGPHRFYFLEAYDAQKLKFYDVPSHAMKIGHVGKGKGWGIHCSFLRVTPEANFSLGKGKGVKPVENRMELPPVWDKIERPLRCMDVFAGCGGLSEGLHQSGVAETKWAVRRHVYSCTI